MNVSRRRIQPIKTKVCFGNLYENYYFTQRKKKKTRKRLRNNIKCLSEQMEEMI